MLTINKNEFTFQCVTANSTRACIGDIERMSTGGYRAVIIAQVDPLIEFSAEDNLPAKAAWLALGKWLDVEGVS